MESPFTRHLFSYACNGSENEHTPRDAHWLEPLHLLIWFRTVNEERTLSRPSQFAVACRVNSFYWNLCSIPMHHQPLWLSSILGHFLFRKWYMVSIWAFVFPLFCWFMTFLPLINICFNIILCNFWFVYLGIFCPRILLSYDKPSHWTIFIIRHFCPYTSHCAYQILLIVGHFCPYISLYFDTEVYVASNVYY